MIWATVSGHIPVADYLVEKGANIEKRDSFGKSPLMLGAEKKQRAAVKFFLSKGAQFTKEDMEVVLKSISKEEMIEAGYYWDLHDATFR